MICSELNGLRCKIEVAPTSPAAQAARRGAGSTSSPRILRHRLHVLNLNLLSINEWANREDWWTRWVWITALGKSSLAMPAVSFYLGCIAKKRLLWTAKLSTERGRLVRKLGVTTRPETRPPPWVNKSDYLISLMSFEVNEWNQQSILLAVADGGRTGISMALASEPARSLPKQFMAPGMK